MKVGAAAGGALLMLPLAALAFLLLFAQPESDDVAPAASGYGDGLNAAGIPPEVVKWVTKSAEQCPEITAPLLAAQLKAESGFNPRAQSPVGAQGIAQFMPGTWKTWGKDADGNGQTSPFDIGDAVMAQGRFMCQLFKETAEYPGDKTDLALAAYNAGTGNVQAFGGIPPFAETQAYIKRIKSLIPTLTAASTGSVALPLEPRASYVNQNNFGNSGSRWARQHTGVDLSTPCGTVVRAATAGIVQIDTTQSWAGPHLVKISTGPGRLTTWYAHMMRTTVEDGAQVQPGQNIGYVGQLGNASGCHLHFEYHPRGGSIYEDATDPVPWLRKSGVNLK